MSNGWLERSLSSLETETRDWPEWKLEAASMEPHLAIPGPELRVHEKSAEPVASVEPPKRSE